MLQCELKFSLLRIAPRIPILCCGVLALFVPLTGMHYLHGKLTISVSHPRSLGCFITQALETQCTLLWFGSFYLKKRR